MKIQTWCSGIGVAWNCGISRAIDSEKVVRAPEYSITIP